MLSFIWMIVLSCCFAALALTSLGRATSVTRTLSPWEARCRATAKPSPPFLPGTHMRCIFGFGLVAVRVAISREMFAPTDSMSWKWLTPRYSELSSATCISSLLIPASMGFVAISGCEPTAGISGLGGSCYAAKREWIPRQSMESLLLPMLKNWQRRLANNHPTRLLDRGSGADGYSLRRHFVVVAS